jgi:hypothetical protein
MMGLADYSSGPGSGPFERTGRRPCSAWSRPAVAPGRRDVLHLGDIVAAIDDAGHREEQRGAVRPYHLNTPFTNGARVVAVATRVAVGLTQLTPADERDLHLVGFLTFVDRPKPDAGKSIARLNQIGITDNVDREVLARPSAWDIFFVRRFMAVFGPISSLFDFATVFVMLSVLNATHDEFRSGWFVESPATQTLVVFSSGHGACRSSAADRASR